MADVTNTYYEGDAFHGYGSQLLVGDGASPEGFDAVADVISITPGRLTTAVIQKTHLRSLNAHHEKLAGMRDSEPFVVVCNWRPDHESQSRAGGGSGSFATGGLLAINISRAERNYKIVLSDGSPGTEWPFRAVCTGFTPGEIGIEGKPDVTIEFTPVRDYSGDLP